MKTLAQPQLRGRLAADDFIIAASTFEQFRAQDSKEKKGGAKGGNVEVERKRK